MSDNSSFLGRARLHRAVTLACKIESGLDRVSPYQIMERVFVTNRVIPYKREVLE